MSNTHEQVIKKFKDGILSEGCNVYASKNFNEQNVLYSYGDHFPLAIERKYKNGERWFLLNGDKYSSSTTRHQSIMFRLFSNQPRVSFTAIKAAGINYETCELIDFIPDNYQVAYEGDANFDLFKKLPYGTYTERKNNLGVCYFKSMHVIGVALLKHDNKYFICGMDDGEYFVSQLPYPVSTVEDAFEALKPESIRLLEENYDNTNYLRQGEWFFLESPFTEKEFIQLYKIKPLKNKALPVENDKSNRHIVTNLYKIEHWDNYFASGTVRHKDRFGNKGTHKMLRLKKGAIYQVFKNEAVGNWSSGGKVD